MENLLGFIDTIPKITFPILLINKLIYSEALSDVSGKQY